MTIKAVIFDKDDVIDESGHLWGIATTTVLGILCDTPVLHPSLISNLDGIRTDKFMDKVHAYYQWPKEESPILTEIIYEEVARLILEQGKAMEGILHALEFVKKKNIPIGLASSAPLSVIEATLHRLHLKDFFDCICSAEHEVDGKPHPAVYLAASKKLNIAPQHCLVLEDSRNGVEAAIAAGMKCFAVGKKAMANPEKFAIAHKIIPSLLSLNETLWEELIYSFV